MIHAHIDKRSAVPWWAAFGAPLIGVPILVALLALGSTRDANANAGVAEDAEAGYVTEHTEAMQASTVLPVVKVEVDVESHC